MSTQIYFLKTGDSFLICATGDLLTFVACLDGFGSGRLTLPWDVTLVVLRFAPFGIVGIGLPTRFTSPSSSVGPSRSPS